MSAEPLPTVALYVPGSRPDRFAKAAATGAVVLLDLEDAVAPGDRESARAAVAGWLASDAARGVPVQVRVNPPGSDDLRRDLDALPADVALRVPKVGSPDDLAPVRGRTVHALLETAAGVENALDVARASNVVAIGLGEADLRADLGLAHEPERAEEALTWVRSRVVVAARAAGLPAPMMSAWPDLDDLAGLAASCRRGRDLGLRGRAAVHPRQVPVIREAFAPTAAARSWAHAVLAALDGTGVARLADGSMVDAAMVRRARSLLDRSVG